MPRTKAHTIDAVISELRVILTAGGEVQLVVHYVEQERDETGQVVRQDPERREGIEVADMTPGQRSAVESILRNVIGTWRRRKGYD